MLEFVVFTLGGLALVLLIAYVGKRIVDWAFDK